jgi:hypothetical protein
MALLTPSDRSSSQLGTQFADSLKQGRKVKVTERRAAEDYAQCVRELTEPPHLSIDDGLS